MPEPTEFQTGEILGLLRAATTMLRSVDGISRTALASTIDEYLRNLDTPEKNP